MYVVPMNYAVVLKIVGPCVACVPFPRIGVGRLFTVIKGTISLYPFSPTLSACQTSFSYSSWYATTKKKLHIPVFLNSLNGSTYETTNALKKKRDRMDGITKYVITHAHTVGQK